MRARQRFEDSAGPNLLDGGAGLVHIGIGELEKVPEQLKDLIAGKKLAAVPNESAERK